MSHRLAVLAPIITLVFVQGAAAVEPAAKCESGKLKIAGKYGACRLNAESKAVKIGETPDFTKCTTKFSDKWQSTEEKAGSGVCPSEGNEALIRDEIIEHADSITFQLSGGVPVQRVFVHDGVVVQGSMGSPILQGTHVADALCQLAAEGAGLSGRFKAWLSDSLSSPDTRFAKHETPYVRVDGVKIADGWTDLTDGTLNAPINVNAFGAAVSLFGAWTGTMANGTLCNLLPCDNCEDWSTNAPGGECGCTGSPLGTNTQWTYAAIGYCNTSYGLYCFEQ